MITFPQMILHKKLMQFMRNKNVASNHPVHLILNRLIYKFYETVPNQESNLYFCTVGHFAVNRGNEKKPNNGAYHSNNVHHLRWPHNYYSRNSNCSSFDSNECLSCMMMPVANCLIVCPLPICQVLKNETDT